jgi:hypothetical protein
VGMRSGRRHAHASVGMAPPRHDEGLIFMSADWEMPRGYIPVLNMNGVRIPLPPGVES